MERLNCFLITDDLNFYNLLKEKSLGIEIIIKNQDPHLNLNNLNNSDFVLSYFINPISIKEYQNQRLIEETIRLRKKLIEIKQPLDDVELNGLRNIIFNIGVCKYFNSMYRKTNFLN